jgi:lysozyme
MKTSEKGIQLIKSSEGFRAEAYKCPAGVLTIGYGTTKGISAGMVVTEDEATALLQEHVSGIEDQLNGLGLRLRQCQFDALVDFIYNLGFGALQRSGLLAMIRVNPDYINIPTEFRKWKIVSGKPSRGLISRREAEIRLYQSLT